MHCRHFVPRILRAAGAAPVPVARAAPLSTLASAAPKLARVTLEVHDVDAAADFYTTALGARSHRHVPKTLALLGDDGQGTGCGILLRPRRADADGGGGAGAGAGPSAPVEAEAEPPATLRPPYLTFAVSNLKTSARHAKRKGGSVGGSLAYDGDGTASFPSPSPPTP